jgi:hypothetical protein
MPNTYIKKADRERKAQTDTVVQTLLDICNDPHASPETKLGAVKTLRPIQELQQQLERKDQQFTQKDEEIELLKRQLEIKNTELEAAGKEWEAALEQSRSYADKVEPLEIHNKKLAEECTHCCTQLRTTQAEKDSAIKRAEMAEAHVGELTACLRILAEEFVLPEDRYSTALRQFKTHGVKLSDYWYRLLDLEGARRYEDEMKRLEELITAAKKQERPPFQSMGCYLESDAEFFRDLFLYELLVHRADWSEKSLASFFQAEKADYSKWLKWYSGESCAADEKGEYEKFSRGKLAYSQALELGRYLTFRGPKSGSADQFRQ